MALKSYITTTALIGLKILTVIQEMYQRDWGKSCKMDRSHCIRSSLSARCKA